MIEEADATRLRWPTALLSGVLSGVCYGVFLLLLGWDSVVARVVAGPTLWYANQCLIVFFRIALGGRDYLERVGGAALFAAVSAVPVGVWLWHTDQGPVPIALLGVVAAIDNLVRKRLFSSPPRFCPVPVLWWVGAVSAGGLVGYVAAAFLWLG